MDLKIESRRGIYRPNPRLARLTSTWPRRVRNPGTNVPAENRTQLLHSRLHTVVGRRDANNTAEDFREMTLIRKTGSHTRLKYGHI